MHTHTLICIYIYLNVHISITQSIVSTCHDANTLASRFQLAFNFINTVSLSVYIDTYVYIYIYIYIYAHVSTYIYKP